MEVAANNRVEGSEHLMTTSARVVTGVKTGPVAI